jgi:hypothetical protein
VRIALSTSVLALAFISSAAGCQACLDEGSQGKDQPPPPPADSTRPIAEGPARMRPKLVAPNIQFVTRDASDDD